VALRWSLKMPPRHQGYPHPSVKKLPKDRIIAQSLIAINHFPVSEKRYCSDPTSQLLPTAVPAKPCATNTWISDFHCLESNADWMLRLLEAVWL